MNRTDPIYEAYTSPGVPIVPQKTTPITSPLSAAIVKPIPAPAAAVKAEEAEGEKTKTLTLSTIDSSRKATHAAYNIVDIIYKLVKDFDTATQVIKTMASVHKNERKRLSSLKK